MVPNTQCKGMFFFANNQFVCDYRSILTPRCNPDRSRSAENIYRESLLKTMKEPLNP